jgi:hypothetical protein
MQRDIQAGLSFDAEHICDGTINPCTCGYRWSHFVRWSDGVRYTSEDVVAKYHALYGKMPAGFEFQKVEEGAV